MGGFEHATPGAILLIILLIAPVHFYISKARRGAPMPVRRIPGIDAVDEACGRAAELGRPTSFTTAMTDLGPVLYACLGVLYYVGRKSALYRSKIIVPSRDAEVLAITEETLREAYRDEGRAGAFDPQAVKFLSGEQFAFAAGYIGMMEREQVGAAFLFGVFAAESLILAEAGQRVGAMQVAASVSPEQVAFFICTCDYTLIGEELFAAAAYLTREPVQLGSLYAQDFGKSMLLTFILIGSLIATWNSVQLLLKDNNQIKNLDYYLSYAPSWMKTEAP